MPPPDPIIPSAPYLNPQAMDSARILLAGPAPPPSVDDGIAAAAVSHFRQAQVPVDNAVADAGVLLCLRTGELLLPTPGSYAVVQKFAA